MQEVVQQHLQQAKQCLQQGQSSSAAMYARKVLRKQKDNLEALKVMLAVAVQQQDAMLMQQYADSVLSIDSKDEQGLMVNIEHAAKLEQHFTVIELSKTLIQQGIESSDVVYTLALAQLAAGQIAEAKQSLQSLLASNTNNPFVYLNMGHVYKAMGNSSQAAQYYFQFIDRTETAKGNGYWSLADLKDYRFDGQVQNTLQQLIADDSIDAGNRALILFALARSFEQQADFEQAFKYMSSANAIIHKYRPFRADAYAGLIKDLISTAKVNNAYKTTADEPRPIFIVGMPRSGTTLVEQILAAHSKVTTTDELPYIERIAMQIQKHGYGNGINNLTAAQIAHYRAIYLQQASQYFAADVEVFIDKNPNNFIHIGLIKTLFPEAKVINMVRNPVDNAFSVYKQYFANGHDYSYNLNAISFYWQGYLSLMFQWSNLYGAALVNQGYENLVAEPEAQIRKLLAYCELNFEPSCLTFYQSKKAVLTPSVSQVKQPINNRSIGSGKQYLAYIDGQQTWSLLEQKANELIRY
ncbi:tetratricopeptide repeat-containing sulfotransferase family protein [Thalassotalea sp. Y01]|uniref:tetratricopeptide repeat-containing sulfotransferase family protein n=1 Tax=Thalassotalea sp. Y01 TaxID=2729613 RepID=UPI00145F360B|nr:tetratricopeptide repeat-containing sulfotransferase family protein [Thalassotalea sp. Y01]NMP17531.1 tetratricopeptide repeat protein [Thalassotalea sp. Y01]